MSPEEMIKLPWSLGFKDRGHGHWDFAIMVDEVLIIECPSQEIAEHIIKLHNKTM